MFWEILFLSSFTISSGKFSKFDASNAILFQVKVFGKIIKETTLASNYTKVISRPSFTRLGVIKQINKVHY